MAGPFRSAFLCNYTGEDRATLEGFGELFSDGLYALHREPPPGRLFALVLRAVADDFRNSAAALRELENFEPGDERDRALLRAALAYAEKADALAAQIDFAAGDGP